MAKTLARIVVLVAALVGAAAIGGSVLVLKDGISAKPAPGAIETAVARRLRSLAIPAHIRRLRNPEPATPEALRDGLEHFADHCAVCHANDGSGDTEIGRGLYPRAPDMRLPATQQLTDGELFYIIEHGVKLTGMPAWGTGTPEGERASWRLVHFIRHLPDLTPEELETMRELNRRSATEWREEEEMRRFLAGEGEAPAPELGPSHERQGGGRR
jgi:mono/diheme cytochrome c family protein